MNYYQARQRATDGKWHWTVASDHIATQPTGGCGVFEVHAACGGLGCVGCSFGAVRKAEPCPGHATPELARRHQRDYELSRARFDRRVEPWGHCEVCTKRGPVLVETDGCGMFFFCEEHATREHLDAVMPELCAEQIISS